MNSLQFTEILESRIKDIRGTLAAKAEEYASTTDRLHNFNRGALMAGKPPAQVLWGFLLKHWVSVADMVDNFSIYAPPPESYVKEKVGDCINYLILLEAVMAEARDNKVPPPIPAAKKPSITNCEDY